MAYRVGAVSFRNTVIDGVDQGDSRYATGGFNGGGSECFYDTIYNGTTGALPAGLYFDHWEFSFSGTLAPLYDSSSTIKRYVFTNLNDASSGGTMYGRLYLSHTKPTRPDEYYWLTASAEVDGWGDGGQGDVEPTSIDFAEVPVDTRVRGSFRATPREGSRFVGWARSSAPGTIISTNEVYNWTFTGTEEGEYEISFIAYFEYLDVYDVDCDVSPSGGGTVNGVARYQTREYEGTSITLSAVEADGYVFQGYYDNDSGRVVSTSLTYTFTLNGNRDLTARFASRNPVTYTVKFDPPSSWHGSHGTVTLSTTNPAKTHSFTADGTCQLFHASATATTISVRIAFTPAAGCRLVKLKYAARETTQSSITVSIRDSDDHTIIVQAVCDRLLHDAGNARLMHNSNNALIHCGI